MNNSVGPSHMVCDVPIALHVQVSVLPWPLGDEHAVHNSAINSNAEPRRNDAAFDMRTSASDEDVRNLFVCVAEGSPELLRGGWYRLHKLVCADPSAWVYPCVAVYDGVDGEYEPAHIDREALELAWPELLQRARDARLNPTVTKMVRKDAVQPNEGWSKPSCT